MGEEALEENARILKRMGMRGLRAFLVGGLGIVAFSIALKRKRREEEARRDEAVAAGTDAEDPTARYLREMDGQGWDVKGHEDEVRKQRAAAGK